MEQPDVIGRRIGAGIIDLGIVVVIVLLVGGIVGNDAAPDAPNSARFGTLDRLGILVLVFAYYFVTETVWAQTLGKRALGIRVVRVDGARPGAGAIAVRTLLRAIDGLFFYLVALIAVFATGPRRQRLGDLAAKTRVVGVDEPVDERPAAAPPPSDDDVISQIMR